MSRRNATKLGGFTAQRKVTEALSKNERQNTINLRLGELVREKVIEVATSRLVRIKFLLMG